MRLDSQLIFVPTTSPLSMVAAAGASVSSSVVDLYGFGVGVTGTNIIGNATVWGTDFGVGQGMPTPKLQISVGTAFTTSDSCTLNLALQLAADDGTGNPDTWTTVIETGAIAATSLTAGKIIGRFDWPPSWPDNLNPRFAKLLGQVPSGLVFTAGTIGFAGVTYVRDDQANKFAAANYTVA